MELRFYLNLLIKKWWIVLPAFLITLASTIAFTFTQEPVYEATATFLVTPDTSFEDVKSFVTGLDVLSRRPEIATTYTEVVTSRLIKNQAAEELGLYSWQKQSLTINSKLQAGTNVLKITVEGNDPALVRDFTNAIGRHTIAYVETLYEAYALKSLDQATLPESPIRPNKALYLALGAVFGLALGAGLAFLSEYLQAPAPNALKFDILDEETSVYNKRYFMQRLREEMSRAKRNSYPLSLVLMNVDELGVIKSSSIQVRSEALRKVAVFLKQNLRQEDIIARLDETTFAFLLPDTNGQEAKEAMEKLQTRIAWTPFEIEKSGHKLNLSGSAGIAAYQCNGTQQNELMALAVRALEEAGSTGYEKVHLLFEEKDETGTSDNDVQ